MNNNKYTLGIDIGSTTVKIAILDDAHTLLFADYERHFANIKETLHSLLIKASRELGNITLHPMITGSGGLTLANHLNVPFVQEVIAVSTSLQEFAPKTDVAIELGGEDAKIIYFEGGNVEQRMNGICAGGTGSFIDQMASLLQTDATGLTLRTTILYIPLRQDAVFLPKPISSRLSMTVPQRKIYRLPFSKRLLTRLSAVLPAVNQYVVMLPSLAVRFTFYLN